MPTVVIIGPPKASKRAQSFAILALASLLFLPSLSHAAPITIPTSLLPGQQYRLAFVTAGVRDATSTSIAVYDAFVTGEANTEAALSSISWQVIGSTATVSARDHTGTAPADYPGVPIFLLNEVKLVDDYADLWDGNLDTPIWIDQHGLTHVSTVWTGTRSTGISAPGQALGTAPVVFGDSSYFYPGWIDLDYAFQSNLRSMYALSEILVVPLPEPSTNALLTLGWVALQLVRRVRLF